MCVQASVNRRRLLRRCAHTTICPKCACLLRVWLFVTILAGVNNRRVTRACCVYLMRAVIPAGAARNTIGSSAPGSYGWGVRQSEHLPSIFCAQYCTATQSRASPLCKLQGSVLWEIFTASFPLACLSKCRQAATKFLGDSVGATTSTAAKAGTSILSGVNGASHALASGIFASGQV